MPADVARVKQRQLESQLARIEADIAGCSGLTDLHHRALDALLTLLASCGIAFAHAPPKCGVPTTRSSSTIFPSTRLATRS